MKRKLIAVALVAVLICVGLGNIVACTPAPTTKYDLIINSTVGGSVTTPGEAGPYTYDEGTVVDLVAEAGEGYRFVNWTGDADTIPNVEAATTTITMNGDYSITANFVAIYELAVSSTAGGSVTEPGEGTFTYDVWTIVDLVAEAEEGHQFVNWTGEVGAIADVEAAISTITMDDHYSITANFTAIPPVQYDFTISSIDPDAIFVGEPEYVTVRASIPYDVSEEIPLVQLQRVDQYGNVLTIEGSLTDDGDLNNGDEITGDGVFSIRKLFSSQVEERILLQILVQEDSQTRVSDLFHVDVFTHLTDAELDTIRDTQSAGVQDYNALVDSLGHVVARDTVLAQIQDNPNVLQAGISEDGYGIWILYSYGVLGALDLSPPGTRGSGATSLASSPEGLLTVQMTAGENSNRIKDRKAIVLASFNWQFGTTDDAPGIYQILDESLCPAFDVAYLSDSAVTVDVIKTLHNYGIVVITTHGDTYYKGILSLWKEKWGWDSWFGQVVFLTGQTATDSNRASHERDLKKGRLAITSNGSGGYYAILPSFIRYYAGSKYPNSLVYIGACRSTYNDSMSKAFLSSGAQTYLGYSEYVISAFAGTVGVEFFRRFLDEPSISNVGEAFVSGQNDGGRPAFFELRGSTSLEKPTADLENGGFETGDLEAWTVSGDGRVVTQLGQFTPVEGSFMGLISTGLGYTVASGSIEQKICLPSDAHLLEFHWNFSSEEFTEWCGSIYQDYFRVDIITDAGTQNLFFRQVDDLCGTVVPSNLQFDQSCCGCVPTSGNDCTVWTTGWQFESIDISAIAAANQNKPVTVRFSAGDVGDSIFDTAILLDEINITVS